MKTEWTPKNLSIAGGVIVSALLILPNLGKGWEALRYVTDTPPTAYAAKQQGEELQSQFDKYLAAQEKALAQQEGYLKAQQEFFLQQQQQLPNQAPPRPERSWWQAPDGHWEYCDWRCDEERNWYREEE